MRRIRKRREQIIEKLDLTHGAILIMGAADLDGVKKLLTNR